MKAITCANYDYMKLMVAELQQQLDEINSAPDTEQPGATGGSALNLVDLSVPDLKESSSSNGRHRPNPFGFVNPSNYSESGLDAFGATPFH